MECFIFFRYRNARTTSLFNFGLPFTAHHVFRPTSRGDDTDPKSAQTILLAHEMRCGRGIGLR